MIYFLLFPLSSIDKKLEINLTVMIDDLLYTFNHDLVKAGYAETVWSKTNFNANTRIKDLNNIHSQNGEDFRIKRIEEYITDCIANLSELYNEDVENYNLEGKEKTNKEAEKCEDDNFAEIEIVEVFECDLLATANDNTENIVLPELDGAKSFETLQPINKEFSNDNAEKTNESTDFPIVFEQNINEKAEDMIGKKDLIKEALNEELDKNVEENKINIDLSVACEKNICEKLNNSEKVLNECTQASLPENNIVISASNQCHDRKDNIIDASKCSNTLLRIQKVSLQ